MGFEVFDDLAFSWFGMSVLGAFLIPYTIYLILAALYSASTTYTTSKKVSKFESEFRKLASHKSTSMSEQAIVKQTRQRHSSLFSVGNVTFCFAWILFVLASYQVLLHQTEELVHFDPYQILELKVGANETDIKQAYRKLSKIYHPDRNIDSENLVEIERQFIRISKAYETLTDVAARENWEKYGNPDGYTGTSITIGLPSFFTNPANELGILLVYFLAFLFILPILVGCWWHTSSQYDATGTDLDSVGIFYRTMNDSMPPKYLLEVLAAAAEFRLLATAKNVKELYKLQQELGDNLAKPRIAGGRLPYIIKTNILLHAYLLRIDIPDCLQSDLTFVLSHAHRLLKSMLDVCIWKQLHRNVVPIIALSQCITQAVWVFGSQLSQLPGINLKAIRQLKKVKTLKKFMELSSDEKRQLLSSKKSSILSSDEITKIEQVCSVLPRIDLQVDFDVDGSKGIVQNDVVTFAVVCKRLGDIEKNEDDSISSENEHENVDEQVAPPPDAARRTSEEEIAELEMMEEKKIVVIKKSDFVESLSPHFPFPKQENWVLLIFNEKQSIVQVEKIQCMRGKVENKITVQIKDAGTQNFEFVLMCDSYIGLDVKASLSLNVKKRPAEILDADIDSDTEKDDFEEDEEVEEEGHWYFLGGASIWEGLIHLFLLYIIALLLADILESRGYISWNPFKASGSDPRFMEKSESEDDHDL